MVRIKKAIKKHVFIGSKPIFVQHRIMGKKNGILILFYLLFSISSFLHAQEEGNPFDLKHRLEEGDIDRKAPVDVSNPFDINRPNVEKKTTIPVVGAPNKPTKTKKRKKVIQSNADSFIFWLITVMLVLMTVLITLYNTIIEKSYRSFVNENFLKMVHRDQGRIVSFPFMIFYILFFINLAVFIFLAARNFQIGINASPFISYLICLGGIILAFLLKHALLMLLGGVFPINKEIRQYSFTIVIFSIILGLALVPFNLFIAFTDPDLARVLIYGALVVIAGAYIYRTIRAIFISSNYISLHTFHFFMYLCTAEIAPVVLLAKWITNQG